VSPAGGRTAGERRARRPFVLNVRSLRSRPGTRQEVHLSGEMTELSIPDSRVPEGAEVRFDGWVESTLGGVTVAGTVTAPWTGICRRCVEGASGRIETEVRELCRDAGAAPAGAIGLPAGAAEEDAYPVGSDELDLQPIVRDACILELPLAPLCSDSCRGICPTCGANRNRDECSCEEASDPRWSALAGLDSDGAGPETDHVPGNR
jgi:uncharacterized protein